MAAGVPAGIAPEEGGRADRPRPFPRAYARAWSAGGPRVRAGAGGGAAKRGLERKVAVVQNFARSQGAGFIR